MTEEDESIFHVEFSFKTDLDRETAERFISSMITHLIYRYGLKGKIWITTIREIKKGET